MLNFLFKKSHFNEIILCGVYADWFLIAAQSENLVKFRESENSQQSNSCIEDNFLYKEKCLELFLLFDKVHLRDCKSSIEIPSLEEEGRITFVPRQETYEGNRFFKARWPPFDDMDFSIRPNESKQFLEYFKNIYYLKPLITEKILTEWYHDDDREADQEWLKLQNRLKVSRRMLFDIMFNLIGSKFLHLIPELSDEEEKYLHWPFLQDKKLIIEKERLFKLQNKLFRIIMGDKKSYIHVQTFLEILFGVADELVAILKESLEKRCLIAWGEHPTGTKQISNQLQILNGYSNVFNIVRCAFKEENLVFPVVETFNDVYRLRKDKRFNDFRELLFSFVEELSRGEIKEIEKLRHEIKSANAALATVGRCQRIGEFITFLSLPAYIVDMMMGSTIVGLSTSIIGTGTTAYSKIQERRHRWILFGKT